MIIQGFFQFHDFSMHGTFFGDFPGFQWFPELVGTLHSDQVDLDLSKTLAKYIIALSTKIAVV